MTASLQTTPPSTLVVNPPLKYRQHVSTLFSKLIMMKTKHFRLQVHPHLFPRLHLHKPHPHSLPFYHHILRITPQLFPRLCWDKPTNLLSKKQDKQGGVQSKKTNAVVRKRTNVTAVSKLKPGVSTVGTQRKNHVVKKPSQKVSLPALLGKTGKVSKVTTPAKELCC